MEKKYYLGKRFYCVVEWDGNEENEMKVVEGPTPTNFNFGCFIGQFNSKLDAWAHLLSSDELKDFLEKRHFSTLADFYIAKQNQRFHENSSLIERHKKAYDHLCAAHDVIPTNSDTISIVLDYLRDVNWGGWDLPKMSIGYRCAQYDCDGKIAVTMVLDKPIDYYGDLVSKFVKGAPVGHLMNYRRI